LNVTLQITISRFLTLQILAQILVAQHEHVGIGKMRHPTEQMIEIRAPTKLAGHKKLEKNVEIAVAPIERFQIAIEIVIAASD
jgi:hypothetical protein